MRGLATIRVRRNPPIEAEKWVRDPRGISILLAAERWFAHVVENHPDMAGFHAAVVGVLRHPELITRAPRSDRRDLYYGGRPRIVVVVEMFEDGGRLVTAYRQLGPDREEKILWTP